MIISKPRLIRVLAALLIIVIAFSFGWWALWRIAAAQYDKVLDGWVAEGRAAGYEIHWGDRGLFGFPNHVVMRLTNLQWQNTDGIGLKANNIDIAASLWNRQKFNTKFKGHVEIVAPLANTTNTLLLSGEGGSAHIELDHDGVWKLAQIALINARLGRSPDYLFLATDLRASARRPEQPPRSHQDTGLTLTGEARNVTLPPAMPPSFGPAIKHLTLDLRVMDAVPDFRKRASVEAWNKDSGVVEFDDLRLDWGVLQVAAKGTVGFDDDLQPEGAFASVIGNADAVLKALMENHFIAPRQSEMLNAALGLFAKPASADGVDGIGVPIAVQLGGFFLGPVKIFAFPEISWPVETSPQPSLNPLSPASPPAARAAVKNACLASAVKGFSRSIALNNSSESWRINPTA